MWAVVLYVLLGLFLLLLAVLSVPVFLQLDFLDELTLNIRFLGIPVFRFSSDKSSEDIAKKAPKKAENKSKEPSLLEMISQSLKDDGVSSTVQYIKHGTTLAVGAVRKLFKIVTVDKLILKLIVASEDAATTAQDTGKICAVLYPAITTLQSVLKIKKRVVTVTPDFLGEKGDAEIHVTAHAMLLRVLWVFIILFRQYSAWQTSIKHKNKEEVGCGK